ncbi:hypothetical protein ACWEWX_54790 [Streptomyces asiaticus]|uniref:hypothetical protein n=1 Tax=Streptomyces asiaticus TaxID=114695 RepID=UPI003D708719
MFDLHRLRLLRELKHRGTLAAVAATLLPSLVWNGAPPTVALRQLPRGRRARRVFTAVRRGRTRHPAIMACRHALRQAAADVAASADG